MKASISFEQLQSNSTDQLHVAESLCSWLGTLFTAKKSEKIVGVRKYLSHIECYPASTGFSNTREPREALETQQETNHA